MARIAWNSMEREVKRELRPFLRDYVRLASGSHSVFCEAANSFSRTKARSPLNHSGQVQVRLLVRMSNDLRVLAQAAEAGYSVQALSLLAGIYELASAAAYIDSDERAARWESHQHLKKSYPSSGQRRAGIKKLLLALSPDENITDSQLEAMVDEEERLYTLACVAKHSNPLVMRNLGVRFDGQSVRVFHGPFMDGNSVKQARFALLHGARLLIAAAVQFARPRFQDISEPQKLVRRIKTALSLLGEAKDKPIDEGLEGIARR